MKLKKMFQSPKVVKNKFVFKIRSKLSANDDRNPFYLLRRISQTIYITCAKHLKYRKKYLEDSEIGAKNQS